MRIDSVYAEGVKGSWKVVLNLTVSELLSLLGASDPRLAQILQQLQGLSGAISQMSQTVSGALDTIMTDLTTLAAEVAANGDELLLLVQQLQNNPGDPALLAKLQDVASKIESSSNTLHTNTANAAAAVTPPPGP